LNADRTFPGLKRFIVNYNEFYIDDGYWERGSTK
jgi:hypothetical protein